VGHVTARRQIKHLTADDVITRPETLAVEEPLEIRVNGTPITVTMRTPGSDFELAQGFLLTEGLIMGRADVLTIRYCDGRDEDGVNAYNVLDVTLAPGLRPPDLDVTRNFYTTSSCGICGKASLDAVRVACGEPPAASRPVVDAAVIRRLPGSLRESQPAFDRTGGLHASGVFDAAGNLLALREDVGRHNALDKLIGAEFLAGRTPLRDAVLLVSGRASFELVQKAAVAGIPIMAAVGAPSSLAVELARERGITLLGFVSADRFNVYTDEGRVAVRAGS
jgi:FdhD protein